MTRRASGVSGAIGLAVAEGAGIATIGFLGAEFMAAPAGVSLSALESLAPALVAGLCAGLYRFNQYVRRSKPAEQTEAPPAARAATAAARGLVSAG